MFTTRLRLFIAAVWSPVGKGLTTWVSFVVLNCVLVNFPYCILGQVWYLIVSISDLSPFFTLKFLLDFGSMKVCHHHHHYKEYLLLKTKLFVCNYLVNTPPF